MKLFIAMLTAFTLIASGCSLAYVRPYRPDLTGRDTSCTDSYAAPVADAVLSAAAITVPVAFSDWESNRSSTNASFGDIIGIFALAAALTIPAVIAAGSGARGALQVHACRSGNEFAAQRNAPMRPSQLIGSDVTRAR